MTAAAGVALFLVYCGMLRGAEAAPKGIPAPAPAGERHMRERTLGQITLVYSAESEPLAEQILPYAAKCSQHREKLFRPPAPIPQKAFWLAKADWRGKPATYGFPYASGKDAYLAAADVDMPTQLALIADAMDIEKGGADVERIAARLGLPKGSTPADVHRRLKESKEFFVVLTAWYILPHELTHGYCNALRHPAQPRWFYEGLAQWAAYCVQQELRSPDEADLIYEYYQLLWTRGAPHLRVTDFAKADRLGAAGLDTPNYAWYHGGLLRLFHDLEEMKGERLLPDLVRRVGDRCGGRSTVSDQEMIRVFSEVMGRDLGPWFAERWGLGRVSDVRP
jgi:hypothetical protein